MVRRLLHLRWKQAGRILWEGGIRLWILLPFVMLFLVWGLMRLAARMPVLYQVLILLIFLSVQFTRKDAGFLRTLGRGTKSFVLLENLSWIIPLEVLYAFQQPPESWVGIAVVLAGVTSVIFSGLSVQHIGSIWPSGKTLTSGIPVDLYEWKALLRQWFLPLLGFYLATFFALPWLPLTGVLLILFALFSTGMAEHLEPKELVQAQITLRRALNRKLWRNLLFCIGLFLLLIGFQLVFHHSNAYELLALLLCLFVLLLTTAYMLLLKYNAFPHPVSRLQLLLHTILILLTAPLLPVSLYLLYRQYQKVQWQLRPYLK